MYIHVPLFYIIYSLQTSKLRYLYVSIKHKISFSFSQTQPILAVKLITKLCQLPRCKFFGLWIFQLPPSQNLIIYFWGRHFVRKTLGNSRNEFSQMFVRTLRNKLPLLRKKYRLPPYITYIIWLKFLFTSLLKVKN